ncbi:MAG: arylesterase [Deltaproteobacteria bacterium]|nr:arylesterase [Deltaproteobacteria bacterium]
MKKNFHHGLILLFLFLICIACSSSPRVLSPLPEDGVILAFGDSITYGTGADVGQSYPEVLEKLIKRRVIRSGVPGEISARGRERLPKILDSAEPDLVILCHGGNDLLQKIDARRTAQNITSMITMIKDHGADVVLIGVPRPGLILSSAPLYEKIAKEMHVPIDNKSLAKILSRGNLKSDYIHPNSHGYALLAEAIAKLLQKQGALVP